MDGYKRFTPRADARAGTVLMAEDNPVVRTTMGRLLETAGYTLLSCSSGKEAIDLLRRHSVDVVLTDHFMPDMNGLDLLKVVSMAAPGAKRILMTADKEGDVAIQAMQSGKVDQFLTKPIGQQRLLSIIDEAINTGRAAA